MLRFESSTGETLYIMAEEDLLHVLDDGGGVRLVFREGRDGGRLDLDGELRLKFLAWLNRNSDKVE